MFPRDGVTFNLGGKEVDHELRTRIVKLRELGPDRTGVHAKLLQQLTPDRVAEGFTGGHFPTREFPQTSVTFM